MFNSLKAVFLIFFFLLSLISILDLDAGENLHIIVTGNIKGKFNADIENQEKNDPLIRLGQSVSKELSVKNAIYFDLGNSFYPGIVSKFSYGSAVMDFFESFNCSGTIISSHDLQIGLNNLRFLGKRKGVFFLSSNLNVSGDKFIYPYFLKQIGQQEIAFIGISSNKIEVDATEKVIEKIDVKTAVDAVGQAIDDAEKKGARYFVLLSGLSFKENFNLMRKFKKINLVITGGDNRGKLFGSNSTRIDFDDKRSILIMPETADYLKIELDVQTGLRIKKAELFEAKSYKVNSRSYKEFIRRISGWKKLLRKDLAGVVYDTKTGTIEIDGTKIADLLRKKYNSEICLLDKSAISSQTLQGKITDLKLLSLIHSEFPIITFKLKGHELETIGVINDVYLIRGYSGGKVQGYSVESHREYRIVATQSVLRILKKKLRREINNKNTWRNIFQTVSSDLRNERLLVNINEKSIDGTFRFISNFIVSFIYENSLVNAGSNIETPPGKPSDTYTRWGIESRLDFITYNRLHYLKFTPMIHYVRQEDVYLSNLLRGTIFYKINIPYFVNPYHKSQLDTVVASVEGLRPTIMRETVGVNIATKYLTGNTGFGIEKEIVDPAGAVVYGFETLLNFNISFLKYMKYSLSIDAFLSLGDVSSNKRYLRSEFQNGLTFKLNSTLGLTLKHVLFYYYSMNIKQHYLHSQVTTSFDFNTDFKAW